jgi:osmotically-inducible protein OsmY
VEQKTRRSDQDIQANVSEELLHISGIGAHIGVAVKGGAVTLSGEVGSLPVRLAAKLAATRVAGVRAVADELEVKAAGSPAANDFDIARAAVDVLGSAVDVPHDTVRVDVRDRVVTLSGKVTWDYQREAAIRAVKHINGVTAVANTISLRRESVPAAETVAGSAIRRNVPLHVQPIKVDQGRVRPLRVDRLAADVPLSRTAPRPDASDVVARHGVGRDPGAVTGGSRVESADASHISTEHLDEEEH